MDSTSRRTRPTPEEIRARAYEIYLERAGRPGDPEADWLRAERELTARAGSAPDGSHDGKTGRDGARAPAASDGKRMEKVPEVVVKPAPVNARTGPASSSAAAPTPAKPARSNGRGKGK